MKPKDKILLTTPYSEFDLLIEKLERVSKKYPGKYQVSEGHIKSNQKYNNEHTVTIIIDGKFIQYCFTPKQNAPIGLLTDIRLMTSLRLLGNELSGIQLLISEIKYVKKVYDEYENKKDNNETTEIESIADILGNESLVDWTDIQNAKENINDYNASDYEHSENNSNEDDNIKTCDRDEWSSGYVY